MKTIIMVMKSLLGGFIKAWRKSVLEVQALDALGKAINKSPISPAPPPPLTSFDVDITVYGDLDNKKVKFRVPHIYV